MKIRLVKRGFSYIKIRSHEFFKLWRYCGFFYAFWGMIWWLCFYIKLPFGWNISTIAIKKKTAWLDAYICKNYSYIVDDLIKNPPKEKIVNKHNIWVFWGQGKDHMPDIIKAAHRQLVAFNDNVILITNENVGQYIHLPKVIVEKVNEGIISLTHYSDIIRNTLLAVHGGLWLDATVWVSGKISMDRLKELNIYSANSIVLHNKSSVRFWSSFDANWSSWCLWSVNANNLLYVYVSEMLQAMAEREKFFFDYVLLDYFIYSAYRLFPSVKRDIDNINIYNPNRYKLINWMDEPYNETMYKSIIENDFVFKLSYRTPRKKHTNKGELTLYGRMLEGVIDP